MRRNKYAALSPAICLAALLALLLCACNLFGGGKGEAEPQAGGDPSAEYPVAAGGVELSEKPARIVSLAPAVTEKLCDLGAKGRLVGISDYCDYPDSIGEIPRCGTAQLPDVEAIQALSPQLVVTEASLPEEAAVALSAAGIPVAAFPHAASVEALMNTYEGLGMLLEGKASGAELGGQTGDQIFRALEELYGKLSAYTEKNGRKKVLYLRLLDSTVATGDTYEGELLRALCMDNLAENYTNWVLPDAARTAEGISELAGLDVIFLDEDFIAPDDLENSEIYGELPAVVNGRCSYLSGIVFERQSLRTVELLGELAEAVYPEALGLESGSSEPDPEEDAGDAENSGPSETGVTEREPSGEEESKN